ncbi:MAG: PTS sugar transporter subunit IIA [Proteobacteria bacterium]|nr:PTS sugar transporter subunit IIA [Pseudomonadota bacterium]MBU0968608.1 PTS sugar transporter subunit IIA [Pseudomonadota bacterium]
MHTITENRIAPFIRATTKKEALHELAELMHAACPACGSTKDIATILAEREQIGSTGIGEAIAIPHGKMAGLSQIEICFGRSIPGIAFSSADNKPVHFIFLLLAPLDSSGPYLKALARLARFLKSPHTRSRLLHAESAHEIANIFAETSAFT